MGEEISWDIRERAEELYITEGCTFEQAASATGVSISQLKRWAKDGDWREKREEFRRAFSEIKSNSIKLRKQMVHKALGSLDPQDVYAVIRLENLMRADSRRKEEGAGGGIDRPHLFLEYMEFVAETLREIDPQGLKVFARNFDAIIQRFKEQHAGKAQG